MAIVLQEGVSSLFLSQRRFNRWKCLTSPSTRLLSTGIGDTASPTASYLKRGG